MGGGRTAEEGGKTARLLEDGDPSRRCTRALLLPIFSTGTTDCKERSGPLCSDRQELLPSVSAPRARTRSRLTPAQKEERPERVLRMARRCRTQEAAVPCGYLDGRRESPLIFLMEPSRFLHVSFPEASEKATVLPVTTSAEERRGEGKHLLSLWTGLTFCPNVRAAHFLNPPPPLATTSRSAGGIVIGD